MSEFMKESELFAHKSLACAMKVSNGSVVTHWNLLQANGKNANIRQGMTTKKAYSLYGRG